MKFKLFGTEIYISFLFTAVIALMLAVDRTGLVIPTLFAVAIHELGHLFAMWVTECEPKAIRLIPASVQIVRGMSPRKHGETAVALCGPAANLVVFAAVFFNWLCFGSETALQLALLNLILGVFNLLPVAGLDGGTLLLALLGRRWDEWRARRFLRLLTGCFAAAALGVGLWMVLHRRFNPSVFLVALYFAVTALLKR